MAAAWFFVENYVTMPEKKNNIQCGPGTWALAGGGRGSPLLVFIPGAWPPQLRQGMAGAEPPRTQLHADQGAGATYLSLGD